MFEKPLKEMEDDSTEMEEMWTPHIDIYAFGICILHLITGRLPYDPFLPLIHRYSEIKSKEEFINTIRQVRFCSSLLKILEHLSRMLPRFDHHQQGSSTYKVHQTLFRSFSISIPACFYCSRMSMWQSTNYYNPNSWWQKMIFRMMMLSFIP